MRSTLTRIEVVPGGKPVLLLSGGAAALVIGNELLQTLGLW